MPKRKVLFIVPYPLKQVPSQRFRFEQYFDALQSKLIPYKVQSFFSSSNYELVSRQGSDLRIAYAVLTGFCRRIVGLFDVLDADFVFVHREATPIGPPIFEWLIANVFRRKLIYDFDDAIWQTDNLKESKLIRILKNRGKVSTICKLAHVISCGNDYLAAYVKRFNPKVVVNPTTIDTEFAHNPALIGQRFDEHNPNHIIIGWTGTRSTLKYLLELEPVLQELQEKFTHVNFLVIADEEPRLRLKRLQFVKWNVHTEIADLAKMDIGVMPLPNDDWTKGKCGFKILQYMALEIPSVSSPVGVNSQIVKHGINGYLCTSTNEWLTCLSTLIQTQSLRRRVGKSGRETVLKHYSVTSNTPFFLSLFE